MTTIDPAHLNRVLTHISGNHLEALIIGYGSQFYGTPTNNSDVDLLVVYKVGTTEKRNYLVGGSTYETTFMPFEDLRTHIRHAHHVWVPAVAKGRCLYDSLGIRNQIQNAARKRYVGGRKRLDDDMLLAFQSRVHSILKDMLDVESDAQRSILLGVLTTIIYKYLCTKHTVWTMSEKHVLTHLMQLNPVLGKAIDACLMLPNANSVDIVKQAINSETPELSRDDHYQELLELGEAVS